MKPIKTIIVDISVVRRKTVVLATLLLALAAGAFLPRATMDTDPENMLEKTERARLFHNEMKRRFNLREIVVLGVINERDPDGVFNPATLGRIFELTEFAKTLRWPDESHPDHWTGVIEPDMVAPSLVDHISQGGPGEIRFEWLMARPPETREEALAIRDKALSNPMLRGMMVSGDGKAVCIYLPLTDKLLSYRVYRLLREKIEEIKGDEEFHVTGLPVAEGAIGVEMFTQMGVSSPLAMGVIFGLLLLFFRKWQLIVLPMIIATVSIVISMGLMIAFGYPVHILSSMLPIFLMSISMVDSVHVLSEFFDVYTREKGREQSIKEVMDTLFAPMLYTSLTTAAGFLSLTLAPIPPARVFGAFLSLGVMIAWIATVTFVPAFIMLLPERKFENFGFARMDQGKGNWLAKALHWVGRLTYGHAKAVLAILAVLSVVSVWGMTRLRINDNYAKRFDPGHPIRQADIALNSHFGGTYTAYLVLEGNDPAMAAAPDREAIFNDFSRFSREIAGEYPEAPRLAAGMREKLSETASKSPTLGAFLDSAAKHVETLSLQADDRDYFALQELQTYFAVEKEKSKVFKNPQVLRYMAGLQAYLEGSKMIGKSTSAADVVSKVHQELIDGAPENFRVPSTVRAVSDCYMQYQQGHRPHDLWRLVTPDYMKAAIRIHFPTGDSSNTKAAVEAVEAYLENHPPPVALSSDWAGLHYINLVLEARLVWGFLKSLAGSFLIVFLMMSFLFRSALWGLLCMAPLTVTLCAIYGAAGLAGKDYDLPVAVLSALSIGMAVDFAIHFLERGRCAYVKEGSWEKAAPAMFGEPARAIGRNVLVIAVGFLPLLTASLVPYKTTGIMLFMILFFSGVVTLLALPAALTVAEKPFFKPRRHIMKRTALTLLMGFSIVSTLAGVKAFAQETPPALTGEQIARKAYHASFYCGNDAKGKVRMTIADRQGRTRNREFNMLRKNCGKASGDLGEDQKFFAFFQSPADVRKTVFMVHKHAGAENDDDRWLYLPGLDLVKRIAAGDKRTSFVGSDFLYEDISGREPDEDRHELVETTDSRYILKNNPLRPESVEFSYYLAHIDKATFLPVKIEFYKSGGRLYRVVESLKVEQIRAEEGGRPVVYPTVTLSAARDLENESRTEMSRFDIQYNIGLGDDIFSERYLRRPPREAMR